MTIWQEIIGELCGGFDYQPHDRSVEEGDIDADMYGFTFENDNDSNAAVAMNHYWPESYSCGNIGEEESRKGEEEGRRGRKMESNFRDGNQLARRRHSHFPSTDSSDAERTNHHRREYGPPPFCAVGSLGRYGKQAV